VPVGAGENSSAKLDDPARLTHEGALP
jgi:hypothetical protein